MLLQHGYVHIDYMFILVPELVECVLVNIRRTLRIDAIFKLKWMDVFNLGKQIGDFLRHGLLFLEIEEIFVSQLFVLECLP